MIDWRVVFLKYRKFVEDEEGIDFISNSLRPLIDGRFTEEELTAIEDAIAEADAKEGEREP